MYNKLPLALVCAFASGSALANANIFELQKAKSEMISVTKSANHIDFTPVKHYDKYIISVSGPNGFFQSFETDTPSLDVDSLDLPNDGTFNYQIQAVTFLKEVSDSLNNGRPKDSKGYISKIDVMGGKFTTENFSVKTFEQIHEKKPKLQLGLSN